MIQSERVVRVWITKAAAAPSASSGSNNTRPTNATAATTAPPTCRGGLQNELMSSIHDFSADHPTLGVVDVMEDAQSSQVCEVWPLREDPAPRTPGITMRNLHRHHHGLCATARFPPPPPPPPAAHPCNAGDGLGQHTLFEHSSTRSNFRPISSKLCGPKNQMPLDLFRISRGFLEKFSMRKVVPAPSEVDSKTNQCLNEGCLVVGWRDDRRSVGRSGGGK